MRIFISLVLVISVLGCVPPAAHRTQKPSTTLLPPVETDLIEFYESNIESIMCLADYLSPQRYLIGVGYERSNEGAKLVSLFDNSPATIAGLKVGDIITKINKKNIEYPFIIDSPVNLEIRRGVETFETRISPALTKSNNAVETKITIKDRKNEKYIYETIITGIELNSIQFKTHYDRSKWMISQWSTVFWKFNGNSGCLDQMNSENIALQFNYSHRNFVNERYKAGHDEFLVIFSKRKDIVEFVQGDISVQDLLDNSAIFINGSREKLAMQ